MFLEFLTATDLESLNTGNESTFQTSLRNVTDIILCSRGLVGDVVGWRVSNEPSLSDYRNIVYRLIAAREEHKWTRIPGGHTG